MSRKDKDLGRPGGLSSATEPQASRPLRASIPDADSLTADERSFMLYAETCCVDSGGMLVGVRMNADDHRAAERFVSLGLMNFGRIPAKLLNVRCEGLYAPTGVTHYAELTEAGWELAHLLRRRRALRRGPYATAVFGHERTLERTAQAIEARRAATTGAVEDESAVPQGCATPSSSPSKEEQDNGIPSA